MRKNNHRKINDFKESNFKNQLSSSRKLFIESTNQLQLYNQSISFLRESNRNDVLFEVIGDGMVCNETEELAEKSIYNGMIIIGSYTCSSKWNDLNQSNTSWILFHRSEGIIIGEINVSDHQIVTVHKLNPKYKDIVINLRDVEYVFRLTQLIKVL